MGVFLRKEPCPECGSSDNLARYSDGHAFCFGCEHYEPSVETPTGGFVRSAPDTKRKAAGMITGTYTDLASRGLRADTLRKFRYQVGEYKGQPCHIAPYNNRKGEMVAQHLRLPKDAEGNKEMPWVGDTARIFQLFGQSAWGSGGRKVVVTEGEIDAMSVAQIQDLRWPVVGAPGTNSEKYIQRASDWLETFDEVIFLFDGDDPGRKAARECAALLTPGKAYIAELPDGYDPNELLVQNKTAVVQSAIFNAQPFRPDNMTSLSDLIDEAVKPIEWGLSLPTCLNKLYEMSYGPKPGQVWIGGAGVGIGKTDIFSELEAHDIKEGRSIAVWHGEQSPAETPKRIAAKLTGKPYFKPDFEYDEAELREVLAPYNDQVHIFDHRKLPSDWDEIKKWVRWVAKVYGVQSVYLDNLTLLSADADDERRFLDKLLKEAKELASQLGVTVHFLSHLTTPKTGKPHEEGGRVEAAQFTGSRAIMRYADYLWALERDTQADDPAIRSTSTFRIIKDRLTGQSTGQTFWLKYNAATSLQEEVLQPPQPTENSNDRGNNAADYGFE